MQDERKVDLSKYRIQNAHESLEVAEYCCRNAHYRDSINRSYYAAFYSVKAVLALEGKDFKRHKDVMAYFNQTYVAGNSLPRECGRKIAQLQQKRDKSDYDDFYVASKEEAMQQLENAKAIINAVEEYLKTVC
ncbi:MAG: HEPN domain-containing protein [Lachnospiraceae bacterium]|nr:HEPN domain-containing protein [Lachnospiraceae bacterium]